MLVHIIGYTIAGLILLSMVGCFITPLLIGSMSKEEREAAGIIWKENN